MATSKKAAAEKIVLNAQVRTEVGKKVRSLRKSGIIPANVFGQGFESKAIKVDVKEFSGVYKQAHETGLIYVHVDGDSIPTLISHMQRHPIMGTVLHVDFRKVNLRQKIETAVPIEIVGESDAVKQLGGVLLTQADHLMVEALPANIPANIAIDISTLTEIGQDIKVQDLAKSDSYEIKEEAEKVIVSITAHKEESVTPETEAVAPEITTAAEGEETAEEGTEAKAEETKE